MRRTAAEPYRVGVGKWSWFNANIRSRRAVYLGAVLGLAAAGPRTAAVRSDLVAAEEHPETGAFLAADQTVQRLKSPIDRSQRKPFEANNTRWLALFRSMNAR